MRTIAEIRDYMEISKNKKPAVKPEGIHSFSERREPFYSARPLHARNNS